LVAETVGETRLECGGKSPRIPKELLLSNRKKTVKSCKCRQKTLYLHHQTKSDDDYGNSNHGKTTDTPH
jgi:hypothetical protein